MATLKPVTVEYWAAPNGTLYARGRTPIVPGGPIATSDIYDDVYSNQYGTGPTHSTVRITSAQAFATGGPVTPPDPPPITPGTRNLTAGALAPGSQTYPVPTSGAVLYVATTGNDTNDGSSSAPLRNVATACTRISTGGTVVVRAGSYNEGGAPGTAEGGIAITRDGVTVMAYPGEAVWFDGSIPWSGWAADTTSKPGSTIYQAPYALTFDRSVQFARGSVDGTTAGYIWLNAADPTGKVANIYDQVFLINGAGVQTALKAVGTIAEVVPGKFYVQGSLQGGTGTDKNVFNATKLFIGDNPASYAEVRVSNKTVAFTIAGTTNLGANVTLKGFGVRRYAPSNCDGAAVKFRRTNGTAENLTVLDTASVAMDGYLNTRAGGTTWRHCTMRRAGLNCAHFQQANGILIEDCIFDGANTHNWMMAPAAGGIKITACVGVTVKRSQFINNNADGFWCDASVFDTDVITCDALNNNGHGFEYEISAKARFVDCLAVGSGKDGFLNRCSDATEFWYCTGTGAGEVIMDATQDKRATAAGPAAGVFGQDSRYSGKDDPVYGTTGMYWWITNMKVRNCVIVKPTALAGALRIRTQDSIAKTLASFGPDVDSNLYGRVVAGTPTIGWTLITTGYSTFAGYKAAGTAAGVTLDAHGLNQDGHDPLNADYSLKTADDTAANAVVQPMPADIAALLGRATGTVHCGAFL